MSRVPLEFLQDIAILYVKVKRSCSRHLWARTDWLVPQYSAGVFTAAPRLVFGGLGWSSVVFGSLRQSSAGSRLVGTGSGLGRDWDVGPDEG